MNSSFDLFEQPFLTWRTTVGEPVRVGFRKLLADAGQLSPFGDAGPQTTFAVIRVLLVLMHQTRPACDDDWQKSWDAGQFSEEWQAEIGKAAAGKFDLFDPKRPFFQRVGIDTNEEAKDKPASYLQSHFAAGTGINFASHTTDDRVALCPACCACGLLELPAFCGAGGSGLKTSINGTLPVYFLPAASTLFHTLLLNWPLADRVPGDHPQWEPGKPPKLIGILEGFTWEPRSVRLFPVFADGQPCTNCGSPSSVVVRRMVFNKGDDATKERLARWRDPHVFYEETGNERRSVIRSLTAPEPDRRPAAALGFWRREAAALLGMSASQADGFGCRAVAVARGRRAEAGLTVSCVVPFTRPGQDKKHLVRGDLWPAPALDADAAYRLLGELEWVEEALTKWSPRAAAGERSTPDIAPRAEFERRAEGRFREVLAGTLSVKEWRAAVRAEVERLTRPVPLPGRALDTARTRTAVAGALDRSFPCSEVTP